MGVPASDGTHRAIDYNAAVQPWAPSLNKGAAFSVIQKPHHSVHGRIQVYLQRGDMDTSPRCRHLC